MGITLRTIPGRTMQKRGAFELISRNTRGMNLDAMRSTHSFTARSENIWEQYLTACWLAVVKSPKKATCDLL